ncbi:MAG: RpiB/LacA/LacB family sugar-phosphate isomerase [Candidatus Adlerbacteria bacterium]
MRIYLASDHAGFELKNSLASFLHERGDEVQDVGPHTRVEDDDYPDYIVPLAKKVAETPGSFGIAVGGSGQGEAMAANRVKGIRAAVYYGNNLDILKLSREHNDTNILSLGARFLSDEEAKEAVELWLSVPFSGDERHVRRIAKLDQHD